MTIANNPIFSDLVVQERDILTRIAAGGVLDEVLRDLVLMVEQPAGGEMLASVLIVSPDGERLLEGAAPNLPKEYNDAINGIAIGENVGSCGTAAYFGRPVIVSDIAKDPLWKDFRELALKHRLHACWSMPIQAADGAVIGTFANYYREPKDPTERDMEVISMVARTTGIAIERHRNEMARKRAEENRVVLLREMNHRVKNVFTLAGALITTSARTAATPQELAERVLARLSALGSAHDLVRPEISENGLVQETTASFRSVVDRILEPYVQTARVVIAGPDFPLKQTAVTGIALVLHELATNAAKYGSLRVNRSELHLDWEFDGKTLKINWAESGLSNCTPPPTTGFGTRLIRTTIERQLDGSIAYDWQADGLRVVISMPVAAVAHFGVIPFAAL